jgi:ribose transport system substrate-binding protein
MVERVGKGAYRRGVEQSVSPTFTIGFAAQTTNSEFSRDVSQRVHRVAEREHRRLVAVNNRYSPKVALQNDDLLVNEGVDLVLEFQTYEHVAPIIASKFLGASAPSSRSPVVSKIPNMVCTTIAVYLP